MPAAHRHRPQVMSGQTPPGEQLVGAQQAGGRGPFHQRHRGKSHPMPSPARAAGQACPEQEATPPARRTTGSTPFKPRERRSLKRPGPPREQGLREALRQVLSPDKVDDKPNKGDQRAQEFDRRRTRAPPGPAARARISQAARPDRPALQPPLTPPSTNGSASRPCDPSPPVSCSSAPKASNSTSSC